MKRLLSFLALITLRGLRKTKPVVVFLFGGLYEMMEKSIHLCKQTVFFPVYAWYFSLTRKAQKSRVPLGSILLQVCSSRAVVHIGLLVLGAVISFPYTSFAERDTSQVPGKNTLLYAVVGPGDQNFVEENEMVMQQLSYAEQEENWRSGSVAAPQAAAGAYGQKRQVFEDVHQLAVGGTAFVKPSFISLRESASLPANATAPRQRGIQRYAVQHGDTLGSIAQAFGISVNTILWANSLTARSVIKPGQTLNILPMDGVVYVVKKGDTIGRIARTYGIQESEIISGNGLGSGAIISVGKQLIIPGAKQLASASSATRGVATVPRGSVVTGDQRSVVPSYSTAVPGAGGYVWPSDARIVTQYYGLRHNGLDIAGKIGTKIYAAQAGTVSKAQCGWNGGYGCYIVIDHGSGMSTLYGHNSVLHVQVGDVVSQGQNISLMGSTGRSTGPHVHFEVRRNLVRINPLQFVR
jgi:LysM repeat protein